MSSWWLPLPSVVGAEWLSAAGRADGGDGIAATHSVGERGSFLVSFKLLAASGAGVVGIQGESVGPTVVDGVTGILLVVVVVG